MKVSHEILKYATWPRICESSKQFLPRHLIFVRYGRSAGIGCLGGGELSASERIALVVCHVASCQQEHDMRGEWVQAVLGTVKNYREAAVAKDRSARWALHGQLGPAEDEGATDGERRMEINLESATILAKIGPLGSLGVRPKLRGRGEDTVRQSASPLALVPSRPKTAT